jgi:dienelactone hydrolase
MQMIRRRFLSTTALPLLAASLPTGAWSRAAASQTGMEPGSVTEGLWRDMDRQRDVPWRLRMPGTAAGAAGRSAVGASLGTSLGASSRGVSNGASGDGGPVPLIIFSHGLGGSLESGTEWARAWADAGMATLHIQHAGSDRAIWSGGLRAVKAAATVEQLVARCRDVRFAVAQLLQLQQSGAPGWARIRPDALGMSGHSFGAHTTLAVAGRAFPARLGDELAEPRFKAFAAFSPAAGTHPDGLRSITRPMLCMTGSLDGDPLGEERSGEYRRAVYDHLPAGAKAQLWLEGADHKTFGGSGDPGAGRAQRLMGRGRPAEAQTLADHHSAVIKSVTTDWWRAWLLEDVAAAERLKKPQGLARGDSWQQG